MMLRSCLRLVEDESVAIEEHLSTVRSFLPLPLSAASYQAHARSLGLDVQAQAEGRLLRMATRGLVLTMLTSELLVRIHSAGLFSSSTKGQGVDETLGVATLNTMGEMQAHYCQVRRALSGNLGEADGEGSETGECLLDAEDHEFPFCYWEFPHCLLVLLLNDEGDAHVGELATLDLRICDPRAKDELPASVAELFAWPLSH